MAPSNLQGLNLVHPIQPQNPYLSDTDLLSVPPFPDLAAQLDLWTNLNFQSDEPLVSRRPGGEAPHKTGKPAAEDDGERYNEHDEDLPQAGIAEAHSHENVVMGTVLPPTGSAQAPGAPPFDIQSFLSSFGIDPFAAPAHAQPSPPSIAQLLSLHAASSPGRLAPINTSAPSMPSASSSHSSPQTSGPTPTPTSKRARTSRASVSSSAAPETPTDADEDVGGTPMTAAEDKRRRNTAASARFRLKKKEREAALERKAKELETRVGELEKECEALRRENGWLKGLVVGVTGAGAVQQQQQQQVAAPISGVKRPREDEV